MNWHLLSLGGLGFEFRLRGKGLGRRVIGGPGWFRSRRFVDISGQVPAEGVRTESSGDAEHRGHQEVVEVGGEGPEHDEDGRVDVPGLQLLVHRDDAAAADEVFLA